MSATPTDLPADLDTSYRILREEAGWWWRERDVVMAEGPDAASYLQGQLSQDLNALAIGASTPSLLLHPDGKVVAWLRVTRVGDDRFALDTDVGAGGEVMTRLRRFLLRVKVELSDPGEGSPIRCLSVRGPHADAVDISAAEGAIIATVAPRDLPGRDVLVARTADAAVVGGAVAAIDPAAYEAIRIEQGLPCMGAELTDRTIPGEAGAWLIDASVSFTKGCYTGQELVARIDSRGNNVPRHLRGIVIEGAAGDPPPVGAELLVGDNVVGSLTSAAWSPGFHRLIALALVGRAVAPPAEATVRWDGGTTTASIRELPLHSPTS